ncbi:MAG: hypothetical protein AAF430_17595 [Myxococcota bacterium]
MSRDEAGLRQGLTDALASRVHTPEGAGFEPAEQAVLEALPLLRAETADAALEILKRHFDQPEDRGEVGQIVHAYGLYRGLHTTLAALGAEILDAEGRPLSEREGFSIVTTDEGHFLARKDVSLP